MRRLAAASAVRMVRVVLKSLSLQLYRYRYNCIVIVTPCPERGDQRTEDRGIGPRGFKNTGPAWPESHRRRELSHTQ